MGRGAEYAEREGTGYSLLYGASRVRYRPPAPEPVECQLPEMIEVESSNLAEIGFRSYTDGTATGALFIRFKDDALFRWDNVEYLTHSKLMRAGSKGKFFLRNIKGLYPSTRLN